MKTRISLVHYLNAAPLGWAFLHGPMSSRFEVIPSSPADCADMLSSGQADIGLIPSIEYERIPGLRIIPKVCISSPGAVRSILLIRPKGVEAIGSVALDTSSRTSVALTKVLLHLGMGIRPEYYPFPPNPVAMLRRCDAALLIGDPALQVRVEDYETIDLAEQWVEWQKKPFVCAVWACRESALSAADLDSVFLEAREWGLARRGEIAAAFAKTLNLPEQFLEEYLYRNIHYDLSPAHVEGLERFYRLAKQENLIPELRPVQFTGSGKSSRYPLSSSTFQ